MKLYKLLVYILAVLLLQSCYTTEPNDGKPPKPPGYQEDIPWPSLANSPWPMYQHDPQNTGRSKFAGPVNGQIKWELDLPDLHVVNDNFTGGIIGSDSTYYVNKYDVPGNSPSYLFAVDFNGKEKWRFPITNDTSKYDYKNKVVYSSPLFINNTIYMWSTNKYLYAIRNTGELKWKQEYNFIVLGEMSIDKDGNLYAVGNDSRLYSINSDGEIIWELSVEGGFNPFPGGRIAFSPDGGTLYITGMTKTLFAVKQTGELLWEFDTGFKYLTAPLIDLQGNIYIGESDQGRLGFVSLKPDGSIRYKLDDLYTIENPIGLAIDKSGNLYLAAGYLTSLDYNGNIRWQNKQINTSAISSSVTVDANNLIYVCNNKGTFFCVNTDGIIMWSLDIGGYNEFNFALNEMRELFICT